VLREPGATAPVAGYILGVFRIPEMLDETIRRHPTTALETIYIDPTVKDPAQQVFHFQGLSPNTDGSAAPPTEDAFRAGYLIREQPLPIGSRVWRVLYRPRPNWAAQLESRVPLVLLVSGLILSTVLAAFVRQQTRHGELIERLVDERTAELRESQHKLDAFLHALPGMAYRGTYADEFEVTYISEGSIALTGYQPEEFMSGRIHLRDIIHPDDLLQARKTTRAAAAAGGEIEASYRIRTRDGIEKWVLSRGRNPGKDAEGHPLFEGLAIDITAQKRAEFDRLAIERKLLEGQKLESLGLLAGGIAHDFNNLLTGVLGNAGLARLSVPPGSPVEPQLRAIEHAALRAAELCRQMLAYAGKGRFVIEPIDLTLLAEALVPLLSTSIARRAELRLDVTRELPAVMGDATQLRQIVMNFVLNAADAIGTAGPSATGRITITTGVMHADAAYLATCVAGRELPPGQFVFLNVADSGCGMPPDVLARIFDPFFTTKFAGRGLGLAAALGIVRSHNGALHVTSTVGTGSSFRLLLPPTTERGALSPPASPAGASWQRTGRALIIDDEADVRQVATHMLPSLGMSADAVADGTAGLASFRENPAAYDIVLLDLMMPGMSGEETLGALRSVRPEVRVLLMSGYTEGDLLRRLAHDRSPLSFLSKPFTRESLVDKLRALLG
jgi:PAS domain S-box-containing protein